MVEKTRCAVECNIYGQAPAKNERLGMIDCDATATHKLYGKRLKWHSLRECAQTALEGLGLHIQTLHKKQTHVQPQRKAIQRPKLNDCGAVRCTALRDWWITERVPRYVRSQV